MELIRIATARLTLAGHDPIDIRQWSEGDLLHALAYSLGTGGW